MKTILVNGQHQAESLFLSILIPAVRINDVALEAISSALNQVGVDCSYEVILLINNPEFNEYDKLPKDKRLVVYQNKTQLGMKENIRHCAEFSSARYIAYLHDDDILLKSYVKNITKILKKKDYDCLIPERYLLFSDTSYGKTLKKKAIVRQSLSFLLFFRFFYRGKIRRIYNYNNVRAMENCFGAPTCGIVFKRDLFMKTNGFESDSVFSFDFDYLTRLNETGSIYLYAKKLGIYRMTDSASNKPDVQYDFFKYWVSLIETNQAKSVIKNKQFMLRLMYDIWDDNTKRLIDSSGFVPPVVSKTKYILFRIKRVLYKYFHNLDITSVYMARSIRK